MKKIITFSMLMALSFLNQNVYSQDLTSINVGTTLPLYNYNATSKVITVQMSVKNIGFFNATAFDVALVLRNVNTSTEYEIDRLNYQGLVFSQLNNGNTIQITGWTVDLDDKPQVPSGTYRVQARINEPQTAQESNYNNNREFFGNISFAYVSANLAVNNVENESAILVGPNPSNGIVNISSKIDLEEINVFSQTGAFIKSISNDSNNKDLKIDLRELSKGLYFLELKNNSEKSWKKIILN